MQIAAADPQFIRKEDVTPDALAKEKDIQRGRALAGRQARKDDRQDHRGPYEQVL